jgi:toxoflavin synthase
MEIGEFSKPREKQYDKIVEGYKQQAERPLRKFAYDYTLTKNICDLSGKRVLDLACGEGISSRMARDLGAEEIVGVDESAEQIKKAQEQELSLPENKRIKYIVSDGGNLPLKTEEKFDVATGMMFLNYAESRERLREFMANVQRHLKSDGTFYAMLPNPDLVRDCNSYGVRMKTDLPESPEGSVVKVKISDFEGKKLNEFTNYYWSRETYQAELESHGFEVEWIDGEVSPEGIKKFGEYFWKDYVRKPIYVMIKAKLKNNEKSND